MEAKIVRTRGDLLVVGIAFTLTIAANLAAMVGCDDAARLIVASACLAIAARLRGPIVCRIVRSASGTMDA